MACIHRVCQDHRSHLGPKQSGTSMKCKSFTLFHDMLNDSPGAQTTVDLATARRLKQQAIGASQGKGPLPKASETFRPSCLLHTVVIDSE